MGRRRSTAASLIEYSLGLEGGGARFEWEDLSPAEESKLATAAHDVDYRRSGVDYYGADKARGAWHVFTYDEPPAAWVTRYNRGEIPPRAGRAGSHVMTLHDRLISYLTQYDKRQSTRRGYNPYALAQYFRAAEDLKDVTDPAAFYNGLTAEFERGFLPRDKMRALIHAGVPVEDMPVSLYGRAKKSSPRTGGTQRRGWARDAGERKHNAFDRMTDAAARWMYVGAWATEWEYAVSEKRCAKKLPWPPGAQLYDYAPETPDEMIDQAREILREVEKKNGIDLVDWAADHNLKPENVGEGIVQEAQGEGVGLWEDVKDHGLKIPRLEVQVEVPELAELGCYD